MFVNYERTCGVFRTQPVEKERPSQQTTEQSSVYSWQNTELRVQVKGLLGLKNRKHNSFFTTRKIMIRSKSNSAHPVDAEAGFMMATATNNS